MSRRPRPLPPYRGPHDLRTPEEGGPSMWSPHGTWLRYTNLYVQTGEEPWLCSALAGVSDRVPHPALEPDPGSWAGNLRSWLNLHLRKRKL